MTIIKSQIAQINGHTVKVDTVKGNERQDIYYLINGQKISYNSFWKLKPNLKVA